MTARSHELRSGLIAACLGVALWCCSDPAANDSPVQPAGSTGAASSGAGGAAAQPAICPAVSNPWGHGLRVEAQCAPMRYTGTARVSLAASPIAAGTNYYVELLDAPSIGNCAFPPRIWIAMNSGSLRLALVEGQDLKVEFHSEGGLDDPSVFRFLTVVDQNDGLLFAHHDYDDRLFAAGELEVAQGVAFSVQEPTCRFDAPCYVEAVRYRLRNREGSLDLGEFESGTMTVGAQTYRVYVSGCRRSMGWKESECLSGAHYEPGFRIVFDVARVP